MKKAGYILGGLLMISSIGAEAQELAPDQNPNYQYSAEKYAQKSDELTTTQSETLQETYKAYDFREAKAEKQKLRKDRQHELRKLRYQSRNRCCRRNNNFNGYNNGYYNNGFYNNGYYGNQNYNNLLYGAGLYYLLH